MELYLREDFDIKKIKCIVFDFDETMYYSDNIRQFYIEFIKRTVMTLGNHDETTALQLMEDCGFTLTNKKNKSFNSSLPHFGITKAQWDAYRIDHFFEIDYTKVQIVKNELYQELKQFVNLFIVSNEVKKNVLYKAAHMGIDLSPFKDIYAPMPEEINTYPKKYDLYQLIQQQGYDFQEMLIIGDRLVVDIEPMISLGGNGILIRNTQEIDFLLKSFLEMFRMQELLTGVKKAM